ncbi:MAG: hypothetical protein K8T90_22130 [Planctomycetes bacterium]|nr:hypothetical protein [Planctomycetota bacterium]
MRCAWCRLTLDYVHGHAACLNHACPMFGLNQAECCSGETGDDGWVPTSELAAPGCPAFPKRPKPDKPTET